MAGSTYSVADEVGVGVTLVGQVAADDQGHLGLDLGLDQAAEGHRLAVAHRHVGKQHAEVGLIDPGWACTARR
jgi:hypothetical protein